MTVFRLIPSILILLISAHSVSGVLPLRDQWSAANLALLRNHPEEAYQLFQEFNQWYAEESATKDPQFRERWHRLWGLSALQTGSFKEGIDLLETWMGENPNQQRFRAFIRFQLASAYLATGDTDSAVNHWNSFLSEHPNLPECALVRWQWADLLIAQSDYAEAQSQLEKVVLDVNLPETGRSLAECALALVLLADGHQVASFDRLESTSRNRVTRLWRAILAPALTSSFLESDQHELAMRSCQWFDSMNNLLMEPQWTGSRVSRNHGSVRDLVWINHWQTQLNKASESARSTLNSEFGLAELYLLRLKTYLKSNAPLKTLFLSRFLLNTGQPELMIIREKVFAYAIEACLNLEKWARAETYVQAFLQEYPNNQELPAILFLQARTSAARSDWDLTISQVDRLIEAYPEHKSEPAWKIAAAGWRAQAGYLENALNAYLQLANECPSHWLTYLQFEQAQCLNKLQRIEEAMDLYQDIFLGGKSISLAEQASLALLKIHLSRMNGPEFLSILEGFQKRFPYSQHLVTADLLLGSFHEFSNQVEQAIPVYTQVAATKHPEADHAHRQLSRIFASIQDYPELRQHALVWISQSLAESTEISEQALDDCYLFQGRTGSPCLPDPLASTLLENLFSEDVSFPCHSFLRVLHNQWEHYSTALDISNGDFPDWLDSTSTTLRVSKRLKSYSVLMLYMAELLDLSGRSDSADTKRIQILSTIDPALLNRQGLYSVAAVAHKYDFPEAGLLLESFLGRYKNSSEVPNCLHMMAQSLYNGGDRPGAVSLLEIIFKDWPDSSVFIPASVQLARLQYAGDSLARASRTIDSLLKTTNLAPGTTAELLLIRARIDLQSGNREKCILNCRRIITLYPDFYDITNKANDIIESFGNA